MHPRARARWSRRATRCWWPSRSRVSARRWSSAASWAWTRAVILDVLSRGLAANRVMELRRASFLNRSYPPGFRVNLHHKDLGIALDSAGQANVPLPLTAGTQQLLRQLRAAGRGGEDHTAILAAVEAQASTAAVLRRKPDDCPHRLGPAQRAADRGPARRHLRHHGPRALPGVRRHAPGQHRARRADRARRLRGPGTHPARRDRPAADHPDRRPAAVPVRDPAAPGAARAADEQGTESGPADHVRALGHRTRTCTS